MSAAANDSGDTANAEGGTGSRGDHAASLESVMTGICADVAGGATFSFKD
jgi:hypothetical protein